LAHIIHGTVCSLNPAGGNPPEVPPGFVFVSFHAVIDAKRSGTLQCGPV
jgi:hypothetical protein